MTKWFSIFEKSTREHLATLPLTIPIGSTIEGYEKAGYEVTWAWTESEPTRINILADKITYEMWCKANGLNPNYDDNYNSYCEWKANS